MTAALMAAGVSGAVALPRPAAAQFFDWGRSDWDRPRPQPRPQPSYNPFQQFFSPFQQREPRQQRYRAPEQRYAPSPSPAPQADYSKAPPPHKPDTAPTTTVAVLGDAMADWLAYGLEDAFGDTPEIGILRKSRTYSGLIRYDPKSDGDWAKAAREILATDKPNYVVMMIGINDRQPLRERVLAKPAPQPQNKDQSKDPNKDQLQGAPPSGPAQPASPQDAEAAPPSPDDQQASNTPADSQPAAPAADATALGRGPLREFRSEKWEEGYGRLIEETVAAMKGRGVPVFWVGLPALRGTKSTSDMTYLNTLFRAHAEKAGAIYIDVWDGFVDESGRFAVQGPDFEGQIRRLRTPDGVFFTRSGARKLAHYVEREIRRVMASRAVPMAVTTPQEPVPQAAAKPGEAPPRPLAGPVVPLTSYSSASPDEQLLGGGASRPADVAAAATRVLVRGEPPAAAKDRADDFVWPRPAAEADIIPPPAVSSTPRPASTPPAKGGGKNAKGEPAGGAGHASQAKPKAQTKPAEHRPRPAKPQNAEAPRGGQRPPMPLGPSAPSGRGATLGGGF